MRQFILIIVILAAGCTKSKSDMGGQTQAVKTRDEVIIPQRPKLYLKTITWTGEGKEKKETSSMNVASEEYLELTLSSMDNGSRFMANKDILKPQIGKPFKMVSMYVVDEKGLDVFFTTTTEFLNYISARGYEMVDQNKARFHTDYTFKRKD